LWRQYKQTEVLRGWGCLSHRTAMSSREIFDLAFTSPDLYSAADDYQAELHPNMMLFVIETGGIGKL